MGIVNGKILVNSKIFIVNGKILVNVKVSSKW